MADPRKNPRYLAILVVASLTILIGGGLLRPERGRGGEESSSNAAPSPTDLARLQRLTQRRSVEAVARVFADLAAQVERRVLSLDGAGRTALIWSRGVALTAAGEPLKESGSASAGSRTWSAKTTAWSPLSPVAVVALTDGPATPPLQRYPAGSYPPGDWALLVWRDAAGRLEYRSAQSLGVEPVSCGGLELSGLTLNTPIDETMLGAGVFDLDEGLFGVVGACEGSPTALSVESAERLVDAMESPEHRAARIYGFRAEPLDEETGKPFGVERGLVATDVWRGYPAFAAGLRPGDVIVQVGEQPATLEMFARARTESAEKAPEAGGGADAEEGREPEPAAPLELTCMRWGRPRTIQLGRAESGPDYLPGGLRWATPSPGAEVGALAPAGPAARAGVRPGDRLLAVNGKSPRGPEEAVELMQSFLEKPAYWTIERRGRLWGAWVRKPEPQADEPAAEAEQGEAPSE